MSASIVLSHLSYATSDGRPLFVNLDLSFAPELTGLVGRNGVGKTTLLKLITGELSAHTGTVSVNGRLGILTQAVQLRHGETIADLFGVTEGLALLRRAETGDATAGELADAEWTLTSRLAQALTRVGLAAEASTPLATLSGGQRTRAALAALVFAEPDFLLLDEPTNNLDRDGRQAVIDLLSNWRAGAIVISHDRELLDHMDAIVELTSLGMTRYGGNWSAYQDRKALELAAARHDLADAEKRVAELDRKTQLATERKARKDSAGHRKGAKGDMPRIVLGGLKQKSENTSGALRRLAEGRRGDAAEAAAEARKRIEILQPLAVTVPSTGLPASRVVLRLENVAAGYVPGRLVLSDFTFTITGPERIAVTGPNGSGKTTMLALIADKLQPWSGNVAVKSRFAMLDQRVSLLDPKDTIRDNFRRLNPEADENACRAALARFMFRADAALQNVGALSGGQMLRAGLACVLGGREPPSLLILDEPTNHLDLDSIAAVEAGLAAYDGALLVVSHDETFLARIGITRRLDMPLQSRAGP
ncbi:ABC-F family ATP-binding cassette domain-containing protein [Aestuariivirga sp. YIM B02566]|uniref:ABC-F family ATP-binding cassette domain-containing protein n=1 Tax=Taklimakanibacter albus TaxID=2800327 RepID=A0ACC5R836_9HYPH|nr:ABC-F family ATP-binding cassette domain-containing protein [Aestuariivirga sp. YIM B02566]MBK1868797.1 ABC-F family ATP-binding cassette domain-containing protein [Aestuariivirga sp. YIM B02566]